jgi:hypothetical protein
MLAAIDRGEIIMPAGVSPKGPRARPILQSPNRGDTDEQTNDRNVKTLPLDPSAVEPDGYHSAISCQFLVPCGIALTPTFGPGPRTE